MRANVLFHVNLFLRSVCRTQNLNCRVHSDRFHHYRRGCKHRSHERSRLDDCLLVPLDTIEFPIVLSTRALHERELQFCCIRRPFLKQQVSIHVLPRQTTHTDVGPAGIGNVHTDHTLTARCSKFRTLRAAVDDGTFCRQVSSTILLVMMQRAENVHSQTFCRLVQSCVQSQRVGHAVSFLSPRSPAVQRSSRMRATSCSLTCPQRRHACADRTRCCPPVHRGAAALALLLSEATKCWPRSHRSAGRALCVFFLMIIV